MTPKLSSYWLYFVTSTSYSLAKALVSSMKVEVVCRNNDINNILNVNPISYELAISKAFEKVENNEIVSSWKDSLVSGVALFNISDFINVPQHDINLTTRIKRRDMWLPFVIPYWEGTIMASGSHEATGFMQLTGY